MYMNSFSVWKQVEEKSCEHKDLPRRVVYVQRLELLYL